MAVFNEFATAWWFERSTTEPTEERWAAVIEEGRRLLAEAGEPEAFLHCLVDG